MTQLPPPSRRRYRGEVFNKNFSLQAAQVFLVFAAAVFASGPTAHAAQSQSLKESLWVPQWMQPEVPRHSARAPASVRSDQERIEPNLRSTNDAKALPFRLFVLAEPRWYREPASLRGPMPASHRATLLNDRAPSHPADGMWRFYDSPALSR